jgi:hypothetical protein
VYQQALVQSFLLKVPVTFQGLPMGAVQNAMTRDGLDPAIMDLDHDKSVASQMDVELVDKGPPLKEDPKYEKYFKMLKMVCFVLQHVCELIYFVMLL